MLSVKNPDRFIYYLVDNQLVQLISQLTINSFQVTKEKTAPGILPSYDSLEKSLQAMRAHMLANQVKQVAMPQIGCGLDKLVWSEVEKRLISVFEHDDVQIDVYVYTPK